jgi:hypothetical protein
MRKAIFAISALMIAGLPLATTEASAQSQSPGATAPGTSQNPGGKPLEFLNSEQRDRMRTYIRTQRVAPGRYDGQIGMGSTLPPSVTMYPIEGDPMFRSYRYSRLNNQIVIVDQTGRVVDMYDSSGN